MADCLRLRLACVASEEPGEGVARRLRGWCIWLEWDSNTKFGLYSFCGGKGLTSEGNEDICSAVSC